MGLHRPEIPSSLTRWQLWGVVTDFRVSRSTKKLSGGRLLSLTLDLSQNTVIPGVLIIKISVQKSVVKQSS